jgi:hypothetical protein
MSFVLTSDSSYSAVIVTNNISSNKNTVNYSVSGTAKATKPIKAHWVL